MRLVDLSVWGLMALPRSTLQAVLDSPFLPLKEGIRRKDLGAALRTLRRHEVSLQDWVLHVNGFFLAQAKARKQDGEDAPLLLPSAHA